MEDTPNPEFISTAGGNGWSLPKRAFGTRSHSEEDDEITVLVEGVIYSESPVDLESVLRRAFAAKDSAGTVKIIQHFQERTDGEFVVAAEHRATGQRVLFNDQFGRLPLFWATHRIDGRLIIGRSASAVARASGCQLPHRPGIAARLLFGYPLDDGTEYAGVTSVPEATLVRMPNSAATPECSHGAVGYGLGIQGRDVKRRDPIIAALGEALITACRRRATRMHRLVPTIALSGGFDSRLVACAMHAAGLEFETMTRSDHLAEQGDPHVARQVATLLSVAHREIQTGPIDTELLLDLVRSTEGALGTPLAHMLGFLINVKRDYGADRFLLTGDGGDKTVAPLLPPGNIRARTEMRRLYTSIADKDRRTVLSLLNMSEQDFSSYCEEAFLSQPGTTAAEKARALVFRQRARRWLSVAEDRNRSVFWSTTPFYSPEFMELTNEITDAAKQRDRLYLALLDWFEPRLARLPRPGRGRHSPVDSLMLEAYLQLSRSPLLTSAYRRLKRNPQPKQEQLNVMDLLRLAQQKGGGIWTLCDPDELLNSIATATGRPWQQRLVSLALRNLALAPAMTADD